jgi:uncharacterized protein (UPF0335 family)
MADETKRRGRPKGSGKPRGVGDNSGILSGDAQKQLQSLSKRIVQLLEERDIVNEDIKEVFNEAKDSGFDTKILRKAIARQRADSVKLKAEEDMIDMYLVAILGRAMDLLDEEPAPKAKAPKVVAPAEPEAPDEPTSEETEFAEVE